MFLELFNRFPMLAPDTGSAGFNDESEDDDPNDKAGDEEELNTDDPEDDAESEEDDDEKKPDGQGKDNSKKEPSAEVKGFTQEDIDRIVDRTIAKERARYEKIQAEHNQKADTERIEKEEKKTRESIVAKATKRYVDQFGYDDQAARELAEEDAERDLRVIRLERELQASKEKDEQITRVVQYTQQKADMLVKQPLAAKFAKEIDAFSQSGAVLDFETAMNFVLGQKLASGELLNDLSAITEQKTLRNIQSRKNKTVEKDGLPGDTSKQVSLTPRERKLAAAFGMTEKEWAKEKQQKK